MLAYSVEGRSIEASTGADTPSEVIPNSHKLAVRDLLHSIDVAADFEDGLLRQSHYSEISNTGRSTWVAIKMSTLLPDPYALVVLSRYIITARERLGIESKTDVDDVPFPGAPRMQDLDNFLSRGSSPESNSMNLSEKEVRSYLHDLCVLYSDLENICTRARDRGMTITIDAEESWYQPAIDLLTLGLMREFNSLDSANTKSPWSGSTISPHRPLIYLTVQAYLRRTPSFLGFILDDAKKNQYALGVKLVRGAYWEVETALHSEVLDRARARLSNGTDTGAYSKADGVHAPELGQTHSKSICLSTEPNPPVWLTKRETDEVYNECVRILLKEVREDVSRCRAQCQPQEGTHTRISAYFGTHNWKSTRLVLEEMVRSGLGEIVGQHAPNESLKESVDLEGSFVVKIDEDVVQRVAMGQLYGTFC